MNSPERSKNKNKLVANSHDLYILWRKRRLSMKKTARARGSTLGFMLKSREGTVRMPRCCKWTREGRLVVEQTLKILNLELLSVHCCLSLFQSEWQFCEQVPVHRTVTAWNKS